MNNDAFRKLVVDRAGIKSTKDIARQAVTEEFQQQRRRHGGKGKRRRRKRGNNDDDDDLYSSDEEEETANSESHPKKSKKGQTIDDEETNHDNDNDDIDAPLSAPLYRDRAKERREGKQSKYMDPFEEYGRLTNVQKTSKKSTTQSVDILPETVNQAKTYLKANDNKTHSLSALGKTIWEYWQREGLQLQLDDEKGEPTMANTHSTHHSYLVVSTSLFQSHPSNRLRSWEIPRTQQTVSSTPSSYQHQHRPLASPFSIEWLDKIHTTLFTKQRLKHHVQESHAILTNDKSSKQKSTTTNDNDSGSEDDDIFGNVGDYQPE